MQSRQVKVLIADDHPVILEGLALLLKPAKNIAVVGFARTSEELLQKAQSLRPDVVVLDVIMPNSLASNNIKALQAALPDIRIVCCSGHPHQEQLRCLINSGIHGFVLKTAPAEELRIAIETAFAGGNYFSKDITDILIESLRDGNKQAPAWSPADRQAFSDKELQIIRMICQEKTVKEIAAETSINMRTIESIKIRIMKKMSVRNIAGVVSYALRNKYVNLDDLSVGNG